MNPDMEPAHPESWITLERDSQGWARIIMAREPVNSMNLPFWQRLSDLLHICEQAQDVRGVVFCRCVPKLNHRPINLLNQSLVVDCTALSLFDVRCSGLKRPVFTAGNDINELYAPSTSRQRHRRFWKISNQFLASLYESPLLTVAAINGACVPWPISCVVACGILAS